MNKNLFKIAIIILSVITFTGCSDDDDDNAKGTFTYNGTTYELSNGVIESYGSITKSSYHLDLTLYSSGLNYEKGTGTGNALYFEIFSSSNSDLVAGTYAYDPEWTGEPLTFDFGAAYINFNITSESGTQVIINEGTVTISKSGSTYTITVNCKDANDNSITGSYTGSLKYYEMPDKK